MTPPDDAAPWRLYRVEEVMKILDKSRATVYRLVKAGLPHHNVLGTGIRFTRGDLDKILEQSARGRR